MTFIAQNEESAMKKELLCIIGLLVIGFPSCKQDRRREDAAKIVDEWTGKD